MSTRHKSLLSDRLNGTYSFNSRSQRQIHLRIHYKDQRQERETCLQGDFSPSSTIRDIFEKMLSSLHLTDLRPEELTITDILTAGGHSFTVPYNLNSILDDLHLTNDDTLYVQRLSRTSQLTIFSPDHPSERYDWNRSETTLKMLVDHVIKVFSLQSIECHRLHLFSNGEELDQMTNSDDLLANLKIAHGGFIDLELIPPLGVRVECSYLNGKTFSFEAQLKDNIHQLKDQIEKRLEKCVLIDVSLRNSSSMRYSIETTDATRTLDELGVRRGSTIYAELRVAASRDQLASATSPSSPRKGIKVFIWSGGNTVQKTEVSATGTVGDLIRKVEHFIRDRPLSRFQMLSQNMIIDKTDPGRCLADLGLKAGDRITVTVVDDTRSTRRSLSDSQPLGLSNLGNTCFMNSALQCLVHLPPLKKFFVDALVQSESENDPTGEAEWNSFHTIGPVTGSFAHLVKNLWLSKQPSYSRSFDPKLIKETIGLRAARFATWDQQDAQEFLSFFLDEIHREISEKNNHNSNTIIKELFFAQMQSKVTCLSCQHSQTTSNPISLLSLPLHRQSQQFLVNFISNYGRRKSETVTVPNRGRVKDLVNAFTKLPSVYSLYKLVVMADDKPRDYEEPLSHLLSPEVTLVEQDEPSRSSYQAEPAERVTLEECLTEFFAEEELESLLRCEEKTCGKQRQMTKQLRFESLPSLLIIQLKRFSHENGFRRKLDSFVEYPLEGLDLSAFLSTLPAQPCLYDLVAVSNHIGSIYGGHYTAFAQHERQWFDFNDSWVTKVYSSKDVISKDAYLLFYLKRS